MNRNFRVGEVVVFAMPKRGVSPGPRAKQVHGSPKGDDYSYIVDKFWRIVSIEGDQLTLVTRRGKSHSVSTDDARLRRPSFLEQIFKRSKFPGIDPGQDSGSNGEPAESAKAAS